MDPQKIVRINELYRRSKAEGLTDAEKKEQKLLRLEYIEAVRMNLRGQLNNIDIKEQDYDSAAEETVTEGTTAEAADSEEEEAASVWVYVCGEVRTPGVYELPEGSRITDAVEAAGGMTEGAAGTYLNLAETVSDGQKIEVPSVEMAQTLEEAAAEGTSGLVNLNRATEAELMTLSGIGESKAKEIIRYRESKGGFQKPEDLMNIPGIKEGVFNKIRDQITV